MFLLANGRAGEAVLGVGQVIFLYDHVEIHLLHSQRTNLTRGLKRHTCRRAVKVPRREASQENQAPTLIIVKDCNSEYYRQRRTNG